MQKTKKRGTKVIPTYQDGEEDFLLNFFDRPEIEKSAEIGKLLVGNDNWPQFYHLSPGRKGILNWFDFQRNATLLEVGAGCGALTGLFCEKLQKVYANELSPIRAEVIRKRHRNYSNLTVLTGSIEDTVLPEKVDYVTVIGVLEYAGQYFGDEKQDFIAPYLQFLKHIHGIIKPKGSLLLAIENKIGLKYLAGMAEDHYVRYFESINGYPHYDGRRTFSKQELKDMLLAAGFKQLRFYYPFPDYKFASVILTDDFLKINKSFCTSAIISMDYRHFPSIFNEVELAADLIVNNIFSEFANSFLVEAQV
jgi:2-polyprenyl-3-methyl-5-hydroxy-6-metoxy-1,4-benzoquinol methylase